MKTRSLARPSKFQRTCTALPAGTLVAETTSGASGIATMIRTSVVVVGVTVTCA